MRVIYILWLFILVLTLMLSSLLITAPNVPINYRTIFGMLLVMSIVFIILTPKPPK